MRKTGLSIVVPTLNEEGYVGKLLVGLSRQAYRNFEVIVVDGNSSDGTVTEAKKFTKRLPKLLIIRSDKCGVSYQRNLGAEKSSAETILFLDADVVIPTRDFLTAILKEFKDKKADIATTKSFPAEESFWLAVNFLVNNYVVEKLLRLKPIIYGWAMLVRKGWHQKCAGFDENIWYCEDSDYCNRVVKQGGKFVFLKNRHLLISTRRIKYEGRWGIFKKAVSFLFYYLLYNDIYKAQKKIVWRGGDFAALELSRPRGEDKI